MKGATVASTGMTPNRQTFGGPAAGVRRYAQEQCVSGSVISGTHAAQLLGATLMPATTKPVRTWDTSHAIKGNSPRPLVLLGGSTG